MRRPPYDTIKLRKNMREGSGETRGLSHARAARDARSTGRAAACRGSGVLGQAPGDRKRAGASGPFYRAYRTWCEEAGEYARSTTDFYAALALMGITRKRTSKESVVFGVRLKMETVAVDPAVIFSS